MKPKGALCPKFKNSVQKLQGIFQILKLQGIFQILDLWYMIPETPKRHYFFVLKMAENSTWKRFLFIYRSDKVKMIFSSWRVFQIVNEGIRLYYYDTSGWLIFVRFWEELRFFSFFRDLLTLICQKLANFLSAQMAVLSSFHQMFIVLWMYNFGALVEIVDGTVGHKADKNLITILTNGCDMTSSIKLRRRWPNQEKSMSTLTRKELKV